MSKQDYLSSRFFYDTLYDAVPKQLKHLLNVYILHIFEEERTFFEQYLSELITDHFLDNHNKLLDISELQQKFRRRIMASKKNWYKNFQHESGSDQQENIKLWSQKEDMLLTDFPFLEEKMERDIKRAINNDLLLIIANVMLQMPDTFISHRPEIFVDYPIFSGDRIGYSKKTNNLPAAQTSLPENKKIDDYEYSPNQFIRSILKLNDADELKLQRYYTLDAVDSDILNFILDQRNDELFYKENLIFVDINDLALHIHGTRGQRQYQLIEKRLHKIAQTRVEGSSKVGKSRLTFTINFFDYLVIRNEPKQKVFAEIRLTQTLKEQLLNNKTISIYSHFLKKLENKVAKLLIYSLQKERLEAYVNERELPSYFDYGYFISRIRFRTRTMESTLKQVGEALDEFLQQGIIIDSYERDGAGFYISLKPLSQSEKDDYFSQSQTKLLPETE